MFVVLAFFLSISDLVKIVIPVEPSIIWEMREISISGHFWPSVTGMICVRYAELCVYNMPGVLSVACVTSFGQKHGSGLHFGLGENREFAFEWKMCKKRILRRF